MTKITLQKDFHYVIAIILKNALRQFFNDYFYISEISNYDNCSTNHQELQINKGHCVFELKEDIIKLIEKPQKPQKNG